MRLGVVKVNLEYVVDLDNKDMVDYAKECLFDDIGNLVKFDEFDAYLKEQEDSNLKDSDIPTFIIETMEEL